jgi:hypothetical protein
MFVKMIRKSVLWGIAALVLLMATPMALTTCDSPMGMGKPIDFEPPILTPDPYRSPMYVGLGAKLTGTVTDNTAVDRVILRDSKTGAELFRATITGDRWEINLDFTEDRNGEKISAEIVAYDVVGNSGDVSIAVVNLIIDIRAPIVEDIWIARTSMRVASFESHHKLITLETEDSRGEKSANVDKYQNGVFTINANISEEETRIEEIKLGIYDARDLNIPLLELDIDAGSSTFSPHWLINEEAIMNAGDQIWPGYSNIYYNSDTRYYYNVLITAIDRSRNVSSNETNLIADDEGYFCMWRKADEPKGILDPAQGAIISRGSPLLVEFFDDDSVKSAYAALFTLAQWNGTAEVDSDVKIGDGNDEAKVAWLIARIDAGDTIYNWKYDKYDSANELNREKTVQLIKGDPLSELLHYVPTGNGENDFGEYVLFTMTDDHKLPPHDTVTSARSTYNDTRIGRYYHISIIDENAPLIVFDTSTKEPREESPTWSGHSPEENTFPELIDGQYFEISGYTLRENSTGTANNNNRIVKFRMAWIPFGINDGRPDLAITEVQNALKADNYPNSFSDTLKNVVQHWEFKDFATDDDAELDPSTLLNKEKKLGNLATANTKEPISDGYYNKQVFRKRFDVLGGPDNINSEYINFRYNGQRENETKLFIFYIEDNLGHEVFRQLRLLGMKRAPELAVYNIFDFINDSSVLPPLPDITEYSNNGDIRSDKLVNDKGEYKTYLTRLKEANDNPEFFAALKTAVLDDSTDSGLKASVTARKTDSYELFTRNTTLIYWIMATKNGKIALDKITMQDVTYEVDLSHPIELGSKFDKNDTQALSYIEYFPDVTQRVFLFTATDALGNIAELQRTIAITNAAQLESITTTTADGTYGTTDEIILKANFTGLVRIETGAGGARPQLNIRYPTTAGRYEIRSIPCEPVSGSVLSLDFKFNAPIGSLGRLQTMYNDVSLTGYNASNQNLNSADLLDIAEVNRPIKKNGARIMDALRDEPAFLPGYITDKSRMPHWSTEKNSLQERKTINLKGILPKIVSLNVGGKTAYSGSNYYFKQGETIEFTLMTTTPAEANIIRPLGTPKLQYYIQEDGAGTIRGPYATTFVYQRPSGSNGMVFSLPIGAVGDTGAGTPYDGRLINVSLITDSANTIVDEVRNPVDATTVTQAALNLLWSSNSVFIKRAHGAPVTTLTTTPASNPTPIDGVYNYNNTPTMTIATPGSTWLQNTLVRTEYSLDGGFTWTNYTAGVSLTDGRKEIRTRYIDMAGNQGAEYSRTVEVKTTFPNLLAVNSLDSSGWYKIGGNLRFVLDFAEPVRVDNANNVTITLRNKNASVENITGGDNPTYEVTLNAVANASLSTTVQFNFNQIGIDSNRRKAMPDGLYISALTLTGLYDSFGNSGGTGLATLGTNNQTITITRNSVSHTCPNLTATLRVGGITPVGTMTPTSSQVLATEINLTNNNRVITIRFNEAVMKGTGTITVRPRGTYAIPPVFEDQGYYIDQSGGRHNAPADGRTYVDSFYDVYNNNALLPADRTALTQGSSLSNLTLNNRTGQSAGPYKKTTHGLIAGSGYTGNYSTATTADGPNPQTGFMVPDTATKWVLDYRYQIHGTGTETAAIRTALTKAKFRWQEIDVVSTTINNTGGGDGRTVTITLNQPLLKGLQWDLYYPEGAFTDLAGNNAAAITEGNYWFWSNGVQAPVIRVNRRSFDARTANWQNRVDQNRTGAYGEPPLTGGWDSNAITVTNDNGWGIADFRSVHYRVESESPNATIQTGVYRGVTSTTGGNRATGAWGNTAISAANPGATVINASTATWTTTDTTPGTWVLNNVIRRAGSNGTSYTVTTKNGTPELRNFANNVRVIRSYNRDLNEAQLQAVALNTTSLSNTQQGVITGFDSLESSKNYVVATATVNGAIPAYGYEGVFRTVVALLYQNDRNNGIIVVEGSNVKNGMPSIAGFPVQDAAESGDNRFIKAFFRNSNSQFYWVSTEIVCEWYLLKWGGGIGTNTNNNGTHQDNGEANNYLMVGYGDLTYSYNLRASGETL